MSFYDFIQIYLGDDTPLGELADLVKKDVSFPKDEQSPDKIMLYCRKYNLEESYLEYIKRALSLYNQFSDS